MSRTLTSILVALSLVAAPALAALPVGAVAPDFRAPAALDGAQAAFDLADARQRGAVVVYFYPAAYTSGCNIQAAAFSRDHARFAAAGAQIVGVSLDGIERLQAFSADPDYCGGKFPVVSDADGKIARAFDLTVSGDGGGYRNTRGEVIGHGFAERTTFVIAPDGTIAATISGLGPERNVAAALEAVGALGPAR
ncbi:MAG: peroxiredoxin [Rhodocyclaceae bacterium]|nr:peroxiredoxin [Rhodocyclaceae bacterium]